MEVKKADSPSLTSPVAFVEGGIQDVYEDACSVCLEEFSGSDPSTVTNCRHEFHLHCILEWCQRSSQCPMCWQTIGLKDPLSQELFEGVEWERNVRTIASRRTTIFQNRALEAFEFGRLAIGANDPELEQRTLLHLATATGMGRVHRGCRREITGSVSRRESSRVSSSPTLIENKTEPTICIAAPSVALTSREEQVPQNIRPASGQTNLLPPLSSTSTSFTHRSTSSYPSSAYQDGGGSSDFQSFSESFKARFNEASMRYKETLSRTTRDLKERLFSPSSSVYGLRSGVVGDITAGITSVSRMMEQLETKNSRMKQTFTSNQSAELPESGGNKMHSKEFHGQNPVNDRSTAASSSANSFL